MLRQRADRLPGNRIPDALYPRLLGVTWSEIDSALQRMHCDGEFVRATGIFRIRHGTSLWARLLLPLLRIPPPTAAAKVELIIRPEGQSETWLRVFDGKPLVSVQREVPAGLLAERFGAVQFHFRLSFADHTIHYQQLEVRLTLPLFSEIPLPAWASPHVSARETAGESEMEVIVSVAVSAPLAGFLFSYEGKMRREGV
jgi:hypothetical protein